MEQDGMSEGIKDLEAKNEHLRKTIHFYDALVDENNAKIKKLTERVEKLEDRMAVFVCAFSKIVEREHER
jgi:inosine/xanthosine triphosphate pyrophosphatase family protein